MDHVVFFFFFFIFIILFHAVYYVDMTSIMIFILSSFCSLLNSRVIRGAFFLGSSQPRTLLDLLLIFTRSSS